MSGSLTSEKVDFFDALPDYDGALFTNKKSKTDPEVARAMLEAAIPALEGLDGWTTEGIHDALIALAEKLAVKNATLMWPVPRIAAAGKGPPGGGGGGDLPRGGKTGAFPPLGLEKLE